MTQKLYNSLTPAEAKIKISQENTARITISFYRYCTFENPQQLRDDMYIELNKLNVLGRIYLANEGVNAQISIPETNLTALRAYLETLPNLNNLRLNTAIDNSESFLVLKIKVRTKIVADGILDTNFNVANKGQYVTPEQLNQLITDPDVVLVDMRNYYEYEVGHFKNAINIASETFRQQIAESVEYLRPYQNKKIIMYCTGGIRCEKATAWLLHNNFKQVYHLEGGIINYANVIKTKGLPNNFKGKNFVFDSRLGEVISDEVIANCHQCNTTCDSHTNCANTGCHLLFIQCPECAAKYQKCCSKKCQEIIQISSDEQKLYRQSVAVGVKIFNKSKRKLSDSL